MIYFLWILFFTSCLFSSERFASEHLWSLIEPLEKEGILDQIIQERVLEIQSLTENWRFFTLEEKKRQSDFFSHFQSTFQEGYLLLESEGAGAAYILHNLYGEPEFIIKPTDENIFCLHNPKRFASPFIEPPYRVKSSIPLYRSSQTEALSYEIATLCQLEHITPKAVLSLVSSPQFFHPNESFEKLCSIQPYLKGSFSLKAVLEDFFTLGFLEEDLLDKFDQKDFEDINLFLWLTFDNDAHPENFRVYPKEENLYGIQKIDNSLAFPEINSGFFNALMYFPHALRPISPKIRSQIQNLPLEEIKKIMQKFGFETSYSALEERIFILQKLLEKKELSYYECNLRLSLLEKTDGADLALSNLDLSHLEYLARDLIKMKSFFPL